MGAEAAYGSTFLITAQPAISLTDEATTDAGDHTTYTISNSAKRYLDLNTAVVVQAEHDEVQSVTITGGPTGGTFTLTAGANTTNPIAYNAAASVVQTELRALASINGANVTVTGSAGGPYTVEFIASLGNASQSLLTKDASLLTGGTSPNVAIAEVQAGSGFATVASTTYTLKHVGGIVVFNSANAQGTTVRIHSGSYYAYSTLGGAHSAEFAGKVAAIDVTSFDSGGNESYIGGLLGGTLKCTNWWMNELQALSLNNRDLLVVSFTTPSGRRFEGYVLMTDCDLKSDVKNAVDQDLTFQMRDEFFSN